MNKDLLPIIAAYLGCDCSYSYVNSYGGVVVKITKLSGITLSKVGMGISGLKLHLRPLWSITEEELRELAAYLFPGHKLSYFRVTPAKIAAHIGKDDDIKMVTICLREFEFHSEFNFPISKVANHLRKKGFCVDQELINAGLVKWKEAKQEKS